MKHWKKYLVLGVAVYFAVLFARFPADLAYGFMDSSLKSANAPLQLYGVSGSVWEGQASQAEVADRVLKNVKWELQPLDLVLGKTSAHISAQSGDGSVSADVARNFAGKLILTDVKGRIGAPELVKLMAIPAIKLDGRFSLNFDELELEENKVVAAEGRLVWNNAATQFPQKLALGDLSADVETTDEGVKVKLSDAGGPLEVSGELLLAANGSFNFDGSFASREGRNSTLGRALNMMGRPGPDGKVKVKTSGNLADFGLK